jgi:hypothetical protein
MAIMTRTIAKGVPPRLHKPKKPRARKANTTTGKPSHKQGHKRGVSQLETEEDETSSDDSEPKRKNKRNSKRRQSEESEAEEELVEEDVDPLDKEVENVDDPGGEGVPDADEVSKDPLSREILLTMTKIQDDGLNDHQRGANLQEKRVKKDSTLDLLTIMSDKVTVKFKIKADEYETEVGRWCNTCK